MKIGILTFHSQLNYGGVLQCLALQTVLEKMGYDVVIIDRWRNVDNSLLECGYNKWTWRQWVKFWLRAVLGLGDMSQRRRVKRTKKFLKTYLRLSPYHFVNWEDAPKELGVDMLVVGSDQVWHCGNWGDPRIYLLEGAPQIPAVAYAASFGMVGLPTALGIGARGAEDVAAEPIYRRGLARFKAISCREREGVEICRELDLDARHVVDPTLLAWSNCGEVKSRTYKGKDLVCYFLSEDIEAHIDTLAKFAKRNKCKVKVFLNRAWLLPIPSNLTRIRKLVKRWRLQLCSRVEVMDSAGPKEFLKAFGMARWVVSDSFHALMFSICNGCDVRLIKPSEEFRQKMFARIEEFAAHAEGPIIVDSVSGALDSFENGESVRYDYHWVESRCRESEAWLKDNIK